MESHGDIVSLGLAPRFREDLCLCQCVLIHHTSCGPGSDTLQCPRDPLLNSFSALSCVFAHCFWYSPIPVLTRFFYSLSDKYRFTADMFPHLVFILLFLNKFSSLCPLYLLVSSAASLDFLAVNFRDNFSCQMH